MVATIFLIVAVIGMFVLASEKRNRLSLTDKETFCVEGDLPVVMLVLIDVSDGLDEIQAERARAMLGNEIAQLPKGGRLDLYLASSAVSELAEPAFRKCNPGRTSSALTSDAAATERRFREDFMASLEDSLDRALNAQEAPSSPLMESLRATGTGSFSRLTDSTAAEVVIISDMLQHSDLVSHYRTYPTIDELTSSPAWSVLITDLHGASVTIGYVSRPGDQQVQGRRHQTWWDDYFREVNARVRTIRTF